MAYDPDKHHRRSIRLKGYDYSQAGAYFVTIVTQDRACVFGDVVGDEVRLNDAGRMTAAAWEGLPVRFPTVDVDAFVVMPNHVHGIVLLESARVEAPLVGALPPADGVNAPAGGATTRVAPTLGGVIGAFKSVVTVDYVRGVRAGAWPPFRGRLWQRNYYEHVVRGVGDLDRIRRYIAENPLRWQVDAENPSRLAP